MTEAFIIAYIPQRVKTLGYENFQIHYREFALRASQALRLSTSNELYFLIDNPANILIESDYGIYNTSPLPFVQEHSHEHRGEITITNSLPSENRIRMIRVLLVS